MLSFLLLVHLWDDSFSWDAACAGGGDIPQPLPAPSPAFLPQPRLGCTNSSIVPKAAGRLLKMIKAGLAHLLL